MSLTGAMFDLQFSSVCLYLLKPHALASLTRYFLFPRKNLPEEIVSRLFFNKISNEAHITYFFLGQDQYLTAIVTSRTYSKKKLIITIINLTCILSICLQYGCKFKCPFTTV